jgi:hypothetical protein
MVDLSSKRKAGKDIQVNGKLFGISLYGNKSQTTQVSVLL